MPEKPPQPLQLIPAIDLKNGQCVRLRQGRMDDATIFSDDPLAMARHWVELGTQRLHLVDLDGAFAGKPKNGELVRQIVDAFPDVDVQIGGGIRDRDTAAAYLNVGVRYIIIGTQAVREPEFVDRLCAEFPDQIIVGLDAKDGYVATDGWADVSNTSAVELAKRFANAGVSAILYTDISRDGMLSGVNVAATAQLSQESGLPTIASGGVANIDDIHNLCAVTDQGVSAAILGRALYEHTLEFNEAKTVVAQHAAQQAGAA